MRIMNQIGRGMAVGLCLMTLGACGGPQERKAAYAAKAQEYIQEGNFPKARVALRNVLKIDPKDPDAYFMFAQVEEREKNWRNAYGNYLKTVELRPDHRGALFKLGKYYLEARAYDKAAETADKLIQSHPDDPAGPVLKATIGASKGDIDEALTQTEAIARAHPTDPDVAILLGTLYLARQRPAEAEATLRRAVDRQPNNIELLNNLGAVLFRIEQPDKTEEILRRIIALEPKVFDHRLRLAGFYAQTKQLDKAEASLREAIRLDQDSEPLRLALAEFLAVNRSPEQGEASLKEAQDALPHSMKIRFALAKLYEATKQPAKARQVYDEMAAKEGTKPSGLDAQVKLAALDLAEGKRDAAQQRVDAVLKDNPRAGDALLLQGRMALDRRDGKEAIQAFRTVLKDQPGYAEGHILLAQAYLLTGERSLARESLEQAVGLDPRQYGARRALAGLDAQEGRLKEAQARLEQLIKEEPKDLGALGLLFDLQIAERNWNVTETTLLKLRDAGANRGMADLAEGNLHQAREEWDQARAAFQRAYEKEPSHPAPLFSLVRLDLLQKRPQEAEARLADILAKQPDHPFAHGMMGEVLLMKGDAGGAERELQAATKANPPWITPWLDLANLKSAQRKPAETVQVLRGGLAANPQAEELRLLLATNLGSMGQVEQAISEYETVLKHNPKSVVAANNLASLLTDHKGDRPSLERALALSRDFEKTAPNPFFLDTLGWVYVKLGQTNEAVRVMRLAVAAAPDQPTLNYHLGMAYYKGKDVKEARVFLEKAVRSGQAFPGIEEAKSILATIPS